MDRIAPKNDSTMARKSNQELPRSPFSLIIFSPEILFISLVRIKLIPACYLTSKTS
jgi:hypothetical protein